jgi:Bacteriophage baseplate protein W
VTRQLDFPFRLEPSGRTAGTSEEDHVRDLIVQVLFTEPGERVNRPDFGCGLKTLVFAPSSDVLATTTQLLVKASLQRWLENEIDVEEVGVEAVEERLVVTVAYRLRATGEHRVEPFVAPAPGAAE